MHSKKSFVLKRAHAGELLSSHYPIKKIRLSQKFNNHACHAKNHLKIADIATKRKIIVSVGKKKYVS